MKKTKKPNSSEKKPTSKSTKTQVTKKLKKSDLQKIRGGSSYDEPGRWAN